MKSKTKKSTKRQAMRKLLVQPLESRVVLAASMGWDGAGQGSAELTYYIANHPSSLTQAETNQAIETALNAWSSVANIKFTQTDQPGLNNSLDFSFSNIDGVSKTLAQSYYPDDVNSARLAGDVQFDRSENWEVGNSKGSQAFDLTYVAVHEIGHALGLDHSSQAGSVMNEAASPNMAFTGLSDSDKAAILKLYAAVGSISPVPESDSDTSNTDDSSLDSGSTDPDADTTPFPKERWRHGGQFHRFGSRFGASSSFNHNVYLPSDVNGDSITTPSDAITIINILNSRSGTTSLDLNNLGLVDTNADGSLTPSDALIVINTLNSSRRITVVIVSATSTSSSDSGDTNGSDSSEETETGSTETGSTETGSSDTERSDSGSSEDGSTDSDSTDNDSSESDSSESDSSDDSSEIECDHDSSNDTTSSGTTTPVRSSFLAWFKADNLVSRFDTDSSGTLIESEVPDHLWQLLVDSSVDSDADSALTQAELETAIAAARQDLFDSKDADGDGSLTSTEVGSRVWNSLSTADTNSSGGVSFSEFDSYISENSTSRMFLGRGQGGRPGHSSPGMGGQHEVGRGKPELWQLAADSLFADFDSDSDGILTATELPSKIMEDLLGKSVDSDSTGSISSAELKAAIAKARETYFALKDVDADGLLTETEAGRRAWKLISSADADSDGSVSLEEFQAWTRSKPARPGSDGSSPTPQSAISSFADSTISSVLGRLLGRFGRR